MTTADLKQAIAQERIKIITLGRAVEESLKRLEQLEQQFGKPAPATRKNRKSARLIEIDQFYTKRKTSSL